VLKDVKNELLSLQKAEADYGVVIAGGKVDGAAMAGRREDIRRMRGWRQVPAVQREDPLPKARKAA
jgi:N-methylhydantoinase B